MLVYELLENTFINVTLDDIGKLLPIIGGSLMGDRENNPKSDSVNYITPQTIIYIEMVELYSKAYIEVSSVRSTHTLLVDN